MSGTLTQQTPVSEELRHDAHVVVLVNYLRRHHVAAFHELSKRVRKLTILCRYHSTLEKTQTGRRAFL